MSAPVSAVPEPSRPPRRHTSFGFARDVVVVIAVAILASFLIKTFLVRSFYIPSPSMETTLLGDPGHHDRILVDELVPRLVPLQRGDVVVFTDPGDWLTGETTPVGPPSTPIAAARDWVLSLIGLSPQDANDHLVKRVIGLPGDHVVCCSATGALTINGAPLTEPYAQVPAGLTNRSREKFDVTVKKGEVWVMGDNRYNSADSAYHHQGVPISDVVGRAFVISWPVSRWTYLGDYPDTFAKVPVPAQ